MLIKITEINLRNTQRAKKAEIINNKYIHYESEQSMTSKLIYIMGNLE